MFFWNRKIRIFRYPLVLLASAVCILCVIHFKSLLSTLMTSKLQLQENDIRLSVRYQDQFRQEDKPHDRSSFADSSVPHDQRNEENKLSLQTAGRLNKRELESRFIAVATNEKNSAAGHGDTKDVEREWNNEDLGPAESKVLEEEKVHKVTAGDRKLSTLTQMDDNSVLLLADSETISVQRYSDSQQQDSRKYANAIGGVVNVRLHSNSDKQQVKLREMAVQSDNGVSEMSEKESVHDGFNLRDIESSAELSPVASNKAQTNSEVNFMAMSQVDIEKFQQNQVEMFCAKHKLLPLALPGGGIGLRKNSYALNRHLLINDDARTMFCFAPKVGCTNLKLLYFASQGLIPREQLHKERDRVNQNMLEEAITKQSFGSIKTNWKSHVLRSYYKFVMYRHPLERLLSGYRSKVQRWPLIGLKSDMPHYNQLRKDILRYKHPEDYLMWKKANGSYNVSISFPDFIDFWSHRRGLKDDEHFQTIFDLCQPCAVRYDFYGNFNNFNHDTGVLVHKIGSNMNFLRDGYYGDGSKEASTREMVQTYFRVLDYEQKRSVLLLLARELEFYYSIFPNEKDSHNSIMNITFDIP